MMTGESITGSAGGGTESAGSEGAEGAADESFDAGASGGDGSEGEGGGESAADKAEKRYQLKWLGRDMELTEKELLARFDDDFEWDFHGAGGKPLMRDGKPLKAKWQDIVRAVQMGNGAADAARKHNERRKEIDDKFAWGKQPENRRTFLQREMGIEDVDTWLVQEAGKAYQRRKQLVELATKDPVAYEREMRADFEAKQKEQQEATSRLEQQRAEQTRKQQAQQNFDRAVGAELKRFNVPLNARTREIIGSIVRDYKEAGAELSLQDLASHVRDQYRGDIFSHLDGHSDEELLKLLGDKRRERLRKAEIAALKAAKKATPPATQKPAPSPRREASGMTAEEFLSSGRRGRA